MGTMTRDPLANPLRNGETKSLRLLAELKKKKEEENSTPQSIKALFNQDSVTRLDELTEGINTQGFLSRSIVYNYEGFIGLQPVNALKINNISDLLLNISVYWNRDNWAGSAHTNDISVPVYLTVYANIDDDNVTNKYLLNNLLQIKIGDWTYSQANNSFDFNRKTIISRSIFKTMNSRGVVNNNPDFSTNKEILIDDQLNQILSLGTTIHFGLLYDSSGISTGDKNYINTNLKSLNHFKEYVSFVYVGTASTS